MAQKKVARMILNNNNNKTQLIKRIITQSVLYALYKNIITIITKFQMH